jgi:hypothetical protein
MKASNTLRDLWPSIAFIVLMLVAITFGIVVNLPDRASIICDTNERLPVCARNWLGAAGSLAAAAVAALAIWVSVQQWGQTRRQADAAARPILDSELLFVREMIDSTVRLMGARQLLAHSAKRILQQIQNPEAEGVILAKAVHHHFRLCKSTGSMTLKLIEMHKTITSSKLRRFHAAVLSGYHELDQNLEWVRSSDTQPTPEEAHTWVRDQSVRKRLTSLLGAEGRALGLERLVDELSAAEDSLQNLRDALHH